MRIYAPCQNSPSDSVITLPWQHFFQKCRPGARNKESLGLFIYKFAWRNLLLYVFWRQRVGKSSITFDKLLIYWKIQVSRNNPEVSNVLFLIFLFKLLSVTLSWVITAFSSFSFSFHSLLVFKNMRFQELPWNCDKKRLINIKQVFSNLALNV